MKKHAGKLNLSKRTISNLDSNAMNAKEGGGKTNGNTCHALCTYTCAHKGVTCGKNGCSAYCF